WHAWMTLTLFGERAEWESLLDERPVVCGRHPQYLALGIQGAQSLAAGGSGSCYDPSGDAGYPKTPIFNGSRFAEIFLWLAGGGYQPTAYKIGLAGLCLLVPLLVIIAARGVGLGAPGTLLALAAALLVWWGGPTQAALHAGDFELLMAALAI